MIRRIRSLGYNISMKAMIIIVLALSIAGCRAAPLSVQSNQPSNPRISLAEDPLFFPDDSSWTIERVTLNAEKEIQEHMRTICKECECLPPPQKIIDAWKGKFAISYRIKSSDTGYSFMLFPNALGYQDMKVFEKHFNCGISGHWPFMLNNQWLVFASFCGIDLSCEQLGDHIKKEMRFR